MNAHQFRDLIGRTLVEMGPQYASDEAAELLMLTAAAESDFCDAIRQFGGGPALGVMQMERGTWAWLYSVFGHRVPVEGPQTFERLEWDLRYAIIYARLRYWVVREPLPPKDDPEAMAAYWKHWYNTPLGAGTVLDAVRKYRKYTQ